MEITYEMNCDDAFVLYYSILLIVDRQSPRGDSEKLASIAKDCFGFAINDETETNRNLRVEIEPRLLQQILDGIQVLSLNVDAAARLGMNVNSKIPGTPYLFRNLGELLPAMRTNMKRIAAILLQT